MSRAIFFEDWKKRGVIFYCGEVQFQDFIPFSDDFLIAEVLERYGIECKKFRAIFRAYEWKQLEKMPQKKRDRIMHERNEFILGLGEIKYIKNFAEKALKVIEEHKEELEKNILPDLFSEYSTLYGCLHPLISICDKALELKRRLHVG